MNTKVKVILMDDIHLEGRPESTYADFQDIITKRIKEIRKEGCIPVVIFAGDIGEGVNGINWFKSIDCDIIYVLGNHEFWDQDYFEEIDNVTNLAKQPGYEHIKFLHNDTVVLHNVRFVGGTMWTNVGTDFPWYNKNYILRYHNVMGDFKRITAKDWYTDENIQRLKEFLTPNDVPESVINRIIEQQQFNPLLELEENQKTVEYIFKELETPFNGRTVVVTHHLPFREPWLRHFNVPDTLLTQEKINDESIYLDVARGKTQYSDKDLLLLGLYTNNLLDKLRTVPNPDFWVHGHLHRPLNDFILGTNVKSSPAGYFKQSATLSYKEFYVDNNAQEFMDFMCASIEKYNWNENIINNLKGFEVIINQFKDLIDNYGVSVDTFYAIANAFSTNHEYARKEIERETVLWLHQIHQWKNPSKKLDKLSSSIIKEVSGFQKFMENHQDANDYRIYNIGVKVDHHSFVEKSQFKEIHGAKYKDLRTHHYIHWLKELNSLQLNVIRYKKALIEFVRTSSK